MPGRAPYRGVVVARREVRPGLAGLFRDMAASCGGLGAPTYADLAMFVADEVESFGPVLNLLEPYADARIGDMVPLRFFAAVHRLVLERQAPELALFYASVGGTPPTTPTARASCRAAFMQAVLSHPEEIARGLRWFPQTNEVGRTVALVALLREIGAAWGLPVRLHEIGTSAVLSLRCDVLAERGIVPGTAGAVPTIVERVGCDVAPLNPAEQADRTLLTSFIWPDQVDRYERLRGALEVAVEVPAAVLAADAVTHVRSLRLERGTTLVLWHSAMWLYLPPEDRLAIEEALADLGAAATPASPLVHIALEPTSESSGEQHVFHLRVTSWPGLGEVPDGMTVTRATTPPTGVPVSWTVPCVGAIVHDDRGRILLIQRGKEPAKGRWSVPGGRVHAGETFADAVMREVREETGLDVAVGDMVGAVARTAPGGTAKPSLSGFGGSTYDIRDYRAYVEGSPGPTAGDDADDARWVGLAELRELPTSPGLLEALEEWGVLPTAP